MINTIIIIVSLLLLLLLSFLLILLFCCFKYLSGEFFPLFPTTFDLKDQIINSLFFLIILAVGFWSQIKQKSLSFFFSFKVTLLLSSIFILNGVVPFSSLLEVKGFKIYHKFHSFCYLSNI